jgi:hypothetical protein
MMQGSLATLWQSYLGIGPVFSLFQSAAAGGMYAGNVVSAGTLTMLGGSLYKIFTLVTPPPKKLEWWETDEFKTVAKLVMLLAMLLLAFMLGVKCDLRRRR